MTAHAPSSPCRTLAHDVYLRMRQDIVSGALAPASKLKLASLVRRYAMGMSPIREALARLVSDRMVHTEDQRGFWVAPLSLEELSDIFRARRLVETEAMRLSIAAGDADWEKRVRQAYRRLRDAQKRLGAAAAEDLPAMADLWAGRNQDFHAALVSACGSPWLVHLQELLYLQTERYRHLVATQWRAYEALHEDHHALYLATLARDAGQACKLAEEHIHHIHQSVRAQLQRA